MAVMAVAGTVSALLAAVAVAAPAVAGSQRFDCDKTDFGSAE